MMHTRFSLTLYPPLQGGLFVARPKRDNLTAPKNLVGEHVKIARLRHRPPLDQVDLAEALSSALGTPFGRTTVTRLETGDRPVTDIELVALAGILGVDITWLLRGDEG